jgi:hypothetical protein
MTDMKARSQHIRPLSEQGHRWRIEKLGSDSESDGSSPSVGAVAEAVACEKRRKSYSTHKGEVPPLAKKEKRKAENDNNDA